MPRLAVWALLAFLGTCALVIVSVFLVALYSAARALLS